MATQAGQARSKKPITKRWWFWVLLVVLALMVVGALTGGGDQATETSSAPATATSEGSAAAPAEEAPAEEAPAEETTPAPEPEPQAPGFGTPARDGKFEFTVSSMDCSRNEVGQPPLFTTAQGVFCIVSVTVTNIGDDAQYFDASSQKAFDPQGREFSADSGAAIYLGGDANSLLEQLNPGSTVNGQLVYDVPPGTQLTELELHDSPFSGGVRVRMG